MELVYRKLTDIKKLEGNPRTITSEDLERLKQSLLANADYFEARPIILSDRTGELVIIAGNQRYEACKQLGWDKVPTVLISNLTEEREREIIIRDNVSNGEWDVDALKDWDAAELEDWGVSVDWEDDTPKVPKDISESIEMEYKIEITCMDEREQEKLFNEMTERGYECRILTL